MKNRTENYNRGKKIRKVTLLPNFVLTLQGKLDSKKGITVADAKINKMKNKCSAIENLECLSMENILFPVRTDGYSLMAKHASSIKALNAVPENTTDSSPSGIRLNNKYESKRQQAQFDIESTQKALYRIREELVKGDTVLNERISKTRNKASIKINAYVKGLRSAKLPEYIANNNYSDSACTIYLERHTEGDNAIFSATDFNFEKEA